MVVGANEVTCRRDAPGAVQNGTQHHERRSKRQESPGAAATAAAENAAVATAPATT